MFWLASRTTISDAILHKKSLPCGAIRRMVRQDPRLEILGINSNIPTRGRFLRSNPYPRPYDLIPGFHSSLVYITYPRRWHIFSHKQHYIPSRSYCTVSGKSQTTEGIFHSHYMLAFITITLRSYTSDPAIFAKEIEYFSSVGFIQVTGITDFDRRALPSRQVVLK